MTGLVRKATLLTVFGLVAAGAVMAGIPVPSNCTIPPCVILMDFPNSTNHIGVNPGVNGVSTLKLVVRDATLPIANAVVTVDFSSCTGWGTNVKLADTQDDPGITSVNCVNRTITKTAGPANGAATGEVFFDIEGASIQSVLSTTITPSTYDGLLSRNVGPTSPQQVCASIYANGFFLATVKLIVNRYNLDQDGARLVTANDRGYVQDAEGYFGSGGPPPAFSAPFYRSYCDYDCNGLINAGDRALMLDAEGNSVPELVYNGLYCP